MGPLLTSQEDGIEHDTYCARLNDCKHCSTSVPLIEEWGSKLSSSVTDRSIIRYETGTMVIHQEALLNGEEIARTCFLVVNYTLGVSFGDTNL